MTADEPAGRADAVRAGRQRCVALARGHRTGLPIVKGLVEPTAARWNQERKGPRDSSDRNPAAAFRIRLALPRMDFSPDRGHEAFLRED